jgi:lipoate-protein ligase A
MCNTSSTDKNIKNIVCTYLYTETTPVVRQMTGGRAVVLMYNMNVNVRRIQPKNLERLLINNSS